MILYLAGPLTAPTDEARAVNVGNAVAAGQRLADAGHTVIVPHIAVEILVAHLPPAERYEAAMRHCRRLVSRCEAVVRLPGTSPGADHETALARAFGLPVYTLEEIGGAA